MVYAYICNYIYVEACIKSEMKTRQKNASIRLAICTAFVINKIPDTVVC